MQAVLTGDFATITSNLNDVLATQINASALRQSWDSTINELSEYQGIISADYIEIQGMDVVIVMLDYTSSGKADLSEYNAKANVEEQVIVDIAEWIHMI